MALVFHSGKDGSNLTESDNLTDNTERFKFPNGMVHIKASPSTVNCLVDGLL